MKKLSILIFSLLLINSLSAQTVDSIIDIRDSQVYKVVKIGQQWWMQENLNNGIMIDSTQVATDNSVVEKYCYHNSLCNIYGGLYQWNEMMDYNTSYDGNPGTIEGICPIGWHLPTDNEWNELTNYLGGENIAGGKLKETGNTHWLSPNTGATNESGFTALPGGFHYSDEYFYGIGNYSYFWSSTDVNSLHAWYWLLPYDGTDIYHGTGTYIKESGFAVRCLRDIDQYSYIAIKDRNYKTVSKLDFFNNQVIDTLLIINSSAGITINLTSIQTSTSIYRLNKSSIVLIPGDSIHLVVSFIPPQKGKYYFDTLLIASNDPFIPEISFPVIGYLPETDSIIDIRDNQIYKVVKIGPQWWMQENLNIGTRINGIQGASDNGITEKYCYGDIAGNCNIYGGLYQWNEMMDYSLSDNGNPGNIRGLCPVGWHLPTDEEWKELEMYVGMNQIEADKTDTWRGSNEGGKLKETGTTHWNDPNQDATNEIGFTALPGSCRYASFDYLGNYADFWSSTDGSSDLAWYRGLSYISSGVYRNKADKVFGFSVRCLRDSSQFSYLTISDLNFRPVSILNFYNNNVSEDIIITNAGAEKTINISSISTKNSAFKLNHPSAVLTSGDSIHLTITFHPPMKDIYIDTLSIVSNDPYNPLIVIPLNGTFPPEVLFTDSSNISCSGFSDGSATVTPSLGTPPYQYQWDNNATDPTVTGLQANIYYRVTVTDDLGWTVMDSIKLSEPEQPLYVLSDYSDIICLNSSDGFINLNPSGGTPPYIYSWSNGAETQNISDVSAGSYSVTVTDNHGCEYSENIIINSSVPYENEKICIVTTDLLSGKNIIVWEKAPDKGVAFYNIYREGTIIGTVPFNALSIFKDTIADPEKRPYLYNISAVDTCDNESAQSAYHKPLFLQYISSVDGVNLTWSKYEVKDEVLDFDSYTVYRGSDRTSLSPIEENIPTEINVFTDNDPQALERKYFYRVAGVLNNPCYPTASSGKKDEPGPYSFSMSNMENNRILMPGTDDLKEKGLSIYPNPFSENTILTFNNLDRHDFTLYIMDLSGKVCRIENNINTSRYVIEKGDLQEGFYIIELRGPQMYRERIIIE